MSLRYIFAAFVVSAFSMLGCSGDDSSSKALSALGLANDLEWRTSKTWNWVCPFTTCEYAYVIDQSPTTVPEDNFVSTTTTTFTGPSGVYYLHILGTGGEALRTPVGHFEFRIDVLAPTPPTAFDDDLFTWVAGTDVNAGIAHYEVAIGSTSGAHDVVDWKAIGNVTSIAVADLALATGSYFGSLRAVDAAGNKSTIALGNGFSYVAPAANAPSLTGLANDATYRTTKTWNWGCSSAPCTYRFLVDQTAITNPAGVYSATATTSQTTGTGTYYLHVQAKNAGGTESAVLHVQARLDNTAPSVPVTVTDGSYSLSASDSPALSWTASTDTHSGIAKYEVSVGNTAGATDIMTWTNVGNLTTHTFTTLTLVDGNTYYANVRAVDTLGNTSGVRSGDGFVVDSTNPLITGIADDSVWTKAKTWNWSCDSSPCEYRFVVDASAATSPTGVYAATATASISGVTGSRYLHVQAKAPSGRVSAVVHVEARIDNTVPTTPGSVVDGTIAPNQTSGPQVTWTASTDADSGRNGYWVAVGTTAGASDVLAWTNAGNVLLYTPTNLVLTSGLTYYTSVRATDYAGNNSTVANGDGWTVPAPTAQKLLAADGAAYDELGEALSASGDVMIAGARGNDAGASNAGAAYFYRSDGTTWAQNGKFVASDAAANDGCGASVDTSGSVAIVGCATGAYIVRYNGTAWVEEAKLTAGDGAPKGNVAIYGDWAVVSEEIFDKVRFFRHSGGAWTHVVTLPLPQAGVGQNFGKSIDIHGGLAVVGSPGALNSGRAYVYRYSGTTWVYESVVAASDGANGDDFGSHVSLFGHQLAVGAPKRNSLAGAVYTYRMEAGTWVEKSILTDGAGTANAFFGRHLQLSGDRLAVGGLPVVGSPGLSFVYRNEGAVWNLELTYSPTNGLRNYAKAVALDGETLFISENNNSDNGASAGAVHTRKIETVVQNDVLLAASDAAPGMALGTKVGISGNVIVATDSSLSGGTGGAYIFRRGAGGWAQEVKLTAGDGAAGAYFGGSIAVFGNVVAIGASEARIGTIQSAGAVYIYRYNGANWALETKLTIATVPTDEFALFGTSVALDGETLVVGARSDSTAAVGAGRAYVYRFDGTTWNLEQSFSASDIADADFFGDDVAIHSNRIVVGSSQASNGTVATGAAYVFEHDGTSWTQTQKLLPPGAVAANDQFTKLAMTDGVLAVVSPNNATAGVNTGALYTYNFDGTSYAHKSTLRLTGAQNEVMAAPAIYGGTIVTGCQYCNSFKGAQHLFHYDGTAWAEGAVLSAYTTGNTFFGFSSAIFGGTVVGGATGVSSGGQIVVSDR